MWKRRSVTTAKIFAVLMLVTAVIIKLKLRAEHKESAAVARVSDPETAARTAEIQRMLAGPGPTEGRPGEWCTGDHCAATTDACEALRSKSTKATPNCAWTWTPECYSARSGRQCFVTREQCDTVRTAMFALGGGADDPDRPTSACRTWEE